MQHRQQKSEITKSRILLAAESEFSVKGFYGARIDEISKVAGVNKRMIYEHFGNKENLTEDEREKYNRALEESQKYNN